MSSEIFVPVYQYSLSLITKNAENQKLQHEPELLNTSSNLHIPKHSNTIHPLSYVLLFCSDTYYFSSQHIVCA